MPFDASSPVFFVWVIPQGKNEDEIIDQAQRVVQLVYDDNESKADKLTLTILNTQMENFDDPIWAKGNTVEVQFGYPGRLSPPMRCEITKVTGFEILTVEALGREMILHKIPRTRTFEAKKKSDVVRQIATEYGYGAAVQDIEDTQIVKPFITQARMTDAQLCAKLAREEGFEFYIDFSGFHFHKRRVGQAPIRIFEWRGVDNGGDVLSVQVENDVTVKPGRVTVKGKDPKTGKPFEVTGSNEETSRETLSTVIEIVDPETGATTLQSNSGTPAVQGAAEVQPASSDSETEAKRKADAKFRKVQQTTVKMTWVVIGDPFVLAKTVGEFRGIGKRLTGKYWIGAVKHTVSSGGYTMELTVKGDGHAGYPVGGGKAVGEQPANGKPNTTSAEDADSGALTPIEVVDPETGATKIQYRDQRGRK